MKHILAIIKPFKFEELREALVESGIEGITVSEAKGYSEKSKGQAELHRRENYVVDALPRVVVEVVVPDESLDAAIGSIVAACCTGKAGDGYIFVSHIDEAVRIRTMERGNLAL